MRQRFARAIAALPIVIASTGASGGASEPAHAAPQYVALDPFVVPIVDSDRLTGNLRLKLVLDAGDAATAEKMKLRLPILRQISALLYNGTAHLLYKWNQSKGRW